MSGPFIYEDTLGKDFLALETFSMQLEDIFEYKVFSIYSSSYICIEVSDVSSIWSIIDACDNPC